MFYWNFFFIIFNSEGWRILTFQHCCAGRSSTGQKLTAAKHVFNQRILFNTGNIFSKELFCYQKLCIQLGRSWQDSSLVYEHRLLPYG